ncbi:MAG: hypothetical protein AABX99_03135 [Nanoarchaeota archaeon]
MTSLDFIIEKEEKLKFGIELAKTESFLAHIISILSPSSPWSKSLRTSYCSKGDTVDEAIERVKNINAVIEKNYADVPTALIYRDSFAKKLAEIEELSKPYLD